MRILKIMAIFTSLLFLLMSCDRREYTPPCHVYGYVYVEDTDPPIPIRGVRVSISSPYRETYTNNDGFYEMYVEYEAITFHFFKSGYFGRSQLIVLTEDEPEKEFCVLMEPREE